MSHRHTLLRCLGWLFATLLVAPFALGQEKKESDPLADSIQPIYVTSRIFQLTAKRGSYKDINDQVFHLKTAGLADEEKWLNTLKKVYPEFTPALLQTNSVRVFRTSRQTTITFGQEGRRTFQIQLLGANSPGDGNKPGTSLVADIGLHFGNDATNPPLSFAMQALEVESGLTYFFAPPRFKPHHLDYINFIRKGAPVSAFDEVDVLFVFALSVDLTRPAQSVRYLNEQQWAALLNDAPKKVQPEVPTALKPTGLGGKVQVGVEIAPDGKVSRAWTHNSTFPEMNREAVVAARQWEFSLALFASDKTPISGLLTFEFAASAAKPAEQKQSQ